MQASTWTNACDPLVFRNTAENVFEIQVSANVDTGVAIGRGNGQTKTFKTIRKTNISAFCNATVSERHGSGADWNCGSSVGVPCETIGKPCEDKVFQGEM